MSRPTDWPEVFGFGDPTPGDPFVVREVARRWGTLAGEAEASERRLRGLLGDDAALTWIGEAGDQFRTRSSELPGQLAKVADSYRQASQALLWWSERLDGHQADADRALVQGRAAKADLDHAQQRLTGASGDLAAANRSAALDTLAPTPGQVQAAQDRLRAAQQAHRAAQGLVEDAQRRLDLARRLADDARELREGDARTTARRIDDAADAGIPERSRWQKIKDGAKAAWDVLVKVATVVVAVLGIVVLIIGGPLAWVVLAAGLVLLADALMKYANGEGSLLDVGLAVLGCIPGTRGLTSFAALRGAFRAGGTLGALAHLGGSARAAVSGMAHAVRGLGAGARVFLRSMTAEVAVSAALRRGLTEGGSVLDELGAVTSGIHKNDPRLYAEQLEVLGAVDLPTDGRLGELLRGYERFGQGSDATTFLDTFTDGAGRVRWPDHVVNGFVPGESTVMTHEVGDVLDRFGDPGGRFLSPDGTPFAERAIPPGNLDPMSENLGYHRYQVLRPFEAETGLIEPWFGQPGEGLQIFLDGSHFPEANGARVDVGWLIREGYLKEVGV